MLNFKRVFRLPRQTLFSTLISVALFLPAFHAQPADWLSPAGLVGWWPGEGDATDLAGFSDGTIRDGVAFVSGVVGQAFVFNGVNGYIEVPDSPRLRFTNEFTAEFWVKRQTLNPVMVEYLLEKGGDWTGQRQNYGIAIHHPNYQHSLHFLCAGAWWGTVGIADLNWHHCAVTARNGDSNPTFYIDGVQTPIIHHEGAGTVNLYPSTKPLHIGAQVDPVNGWNYYSDSIIDEMTLYDRILQPSEILAIYQMGSEGKCSRPLIGIPPRSQLGYWGKTVFFSVSARGTSPLSYQWQKEGVSISGATGSSLVLTNPAMSDGGVYSVVVTNVCGSAVSQPAFLTMNPAGVSLGLLPAVTIDGVVGFTYTIQRTADLGNTNSWTTMTNLTLVEPVQMWIDTNIDAMLPQHSKQFYRVLPGP